MIHNPILPGFNPDPCLCAKGDDIYLAVSTFEWFPGIPVYHSKDLKHWELLTHILTDDEQVNLKGLPSGKGIWAPCLTYSKDEDLFYLVYGVMRNMNARYFDIDNYVVTAKDICGPWSKPVYLHSAGFDASLFHDRDGKKYLTCLEWETRSNYEKPGAICLVEYDAENQSLVGTPQRIWRGATERGCIEGPHIFRHGDYYYILCAEGGTGYNHSSALGRSRNIWGPYEPDPQGAFLTAQPLETNERADWDHLKPRYYNPASDLQKAGHSSYLELPDGQAYVAHLCARPFTPELRCTLGRETALQKVCWSEDGWLRLAQGGKTVYADVPEPGLPEVPMAKLPELDHFDGPELGNFYYSPRLMPHRFADVTSRPGWLRLVGQEALTSLYHVSLLARKLTGLHAQITTRMDFAPQTYQHSAGLVLYYDNMDYICLSKYWSETLGGPALMVDQLENGAHTPYLDSRILAGDDPVYLRVSVQDQKTWFSWSTDGKNFQQIGPEFDTSKLSDEYCSFGEFTGTMAGVFCSDRLMRQKHADFDFFAYLDLSASSEDSGN